MCRAWLRRFDRRSGSFAMACLLAATIVVEASGQAAPPPAQASSAPGAGPAVGAPQMTEADRVAAALTQRSCKDQCHTEDRIVETRRAAFEWARVMVDMEARGARASEEEFAVIQRYLTRNYGFVNVNRASASEIRAVLGVEPAVATAILERRKSVGPFVDMSALAEVPGLDRKALEAQAEAIRFN